MRPKIQIKQQEAMGTKREEWGLKLLIKTKEKGIS